MSNYNYKANKSMFPIKIGNSTKTDDAVFTSVCGLCASSPFTNHEPEPEINWKKQSEYWESKYLKLAKKMKNALGIVD